MNENKLRVKVQGVTSAMGSGSHFLFDWRVLRYFRIDGHNWRKKKDGKTVKEAQGMFWVMLLCFVDLNFKLEALMYFIATMPMEKIMKIFEGVATGCLKKKYHIPSVPFFVPLHLHLTVALAQRTKVLDHDRPRHGPAERDTANFTLVYAWMIYICSQNCKREVKLVDLAFWKKEAKVKSEGQDTVYILFNLCL
ncbi:unnamed protein product [Fraxinus pennsylvanica]|uniref:CG-1 domain-containing protein n=1 Tax=Fraxinus pennsylvanica TaxID=56036 RepID=A0AAD2A9G2_9LAMI|nr:unnamed protein product [Fraxinus pennsylvanica]